MDRGNGPEKDSRPVDLQWRKPDVQTGVERCADPRILPAAARDYSLITVSVCPCVCLYVCLCVRVFVRVLVWFLRQDVVERRKNNTGQHQQPTSARRV